MLLRAIKVKKLVMPFNKCSLTSLLFLSTILLQTANGLPVGAEYAGTNTYVFSQASRTLKVDVEYGVYEAATVAWDDSLSLTGNYIYAYEIYNNLSSNVEVSLFSVSILDSVSVLDVGSADWESGVEPFLSYFSPDQINAKSAEFWFAPLTGFIGVGEHSDILFFTSDNPWTESDGFGAIHGGVVIGEISNLPTAVPEPSMVALLAAGACLLKFAGAGRRGV